MTMPSINKASALLILGFVGLVCGPLVLSGFEMSLLGQFLALAILAIGLDVIWGYTGILSLGQSVFFGLGGYVMAMYLEASSLQPGQVPDFMSWSGVTQLPLVWQLARHFPLTIALVIGVPWIVAFGLGFLIFRSRIKGVYFSILTQALAVVAATLAVNRQNFTGGSSGLTGFTQIAGASLYAHATQVALYEVSLLALGVAYLLAWRLCHSPFGRVLVAVRDGETRLRFFGYDPAAFKTFVFAFAAVLAGISGALFVPQNGIIAPAQLGVAPAIEMVIWVAIGGRGTIVGAVVGTLFVNYAKFYLSNHYPNAWLYFVGGLFVLVVLVMPEGLAGISRRVLKHFRSPEARSHDQGTEPA
ncbi:MAG TPA: urea ABC transporter permease subunit UrtC [Acidiferrobacter sp.]|nr:urea ABC transporter permease subunit UrtC [Acidiferrobacter sp.]